MILFALLTFVELLTIIDFHFIMATHEFLEEYYTEYC